MAVSDYSIVLPEAGDPPTQADVVKVFAKEDAGVSQLFALASDGTVTQLTPSSAIPVPVSIANGGTATSTAPANGQLLIGNAGSYNVASLTAGSNVSITPGPGSITIASGPTAPSTAGDVVVAVSSVAPGTQVIAANANRRGLMIGNCAGGRTIYLRLGATAATASQYAVALAPGATYELPFPTYTGAIQALASGGGAIVLVQELT